jgi:hypothetical protein
MLYEALVKSSSLRRKSFHRGEDICRQVLQLCAPRFRNRLL